MVRILSRPRIRLRGLAGTASAGGVSFAVRPATIVVAVLVPIVAVYLSIAYNLFGPPSSSFSSSLSLSLSLSLSSSLSSSSSSSDYSHRGKVEEGGESDKDVVASMEETGEVEAEADADAVTYDDSSSVSSSSYNYDSVVTNRFPRYGTDRFAELCNWTAAARPAAAAAAADSSFASNDNDNAYQDGGCDLLVRPNPKSGEGLASWATAIVSGYIASLQTNCRLLIDYGPDVDITSILEPQPPSHRYKQFTLVNWTLPNDEYVCGTKPKRTATETLDTEKEKRVENRRKCHSVTDNWKRQHMASIVRGIRNRPPGLPIPVPAPKYRFAYVKGSGSASSLASVTELANQARDVEVALPGYRFETGMACAYERLFRLKRPDAASYSDGLFQRILPALHDEEALVLALYIRTGRTDIAARAEEEGKDVGEDTSGIGPKTLPGRVVSRAIDVESLVLARERHAESRNENKARTRQSGKSRYARVVWLVITDSPKLKTLIADAYDGKVASSSSFDEACSRARARARARERGLADHFNQMEELTDRHNIEPPISVPRTVLTTTSRGTQTKPKRGPSTTDFAEAFLDWYLIGESDLVLSAGGLSFGSTGALRTARPIVSGVVAENCTLDVVTFDF